MAKVADASAKPAGSQPGPLPPVAKPVASPAPPPPPPPQPAAVTAPSPAVQTQAGATQQSPSQADQQGPGSLRYGTAIGGARALERPGLNEVVAAPALVVASADSAVQWRVSNQRVIEHSADRGATWATQYALDPKATLTAGSSPTPLVAWLVGQGGLVMLTTDGRTWRRVAFPEAVDLVAVLAIDARTATVRASDRRSFTTADGGASWTVKP